MQESEMGANNTLQFSINATRMIASASIKAAQILIKFIMMCNLKIQSNRELTGGERSLAAMLKSGGSLQCVTMSADDYAKLKGNARKYNIQHGSIDVEDRDYVTVFIRNTDAPQFKQFVKDFKIGVTEHGTVDTEPSKNAEHSIDKILADKATLQTYVNKDNMFDLCSLRDDIISGGTSYEEFIAMLDDILDRLSEQGFKNIDLTKAEIIDPNIEVLAANLTEPQQSVAKETEITENLSTAGLPKQGEVPDTPEVNLEVTMRNVKDSNLPEEVARSEPVKAFTAILSQAPEKTNYAAKCEELTKLAREQSKGVDIDVKPDVEAALPTTDL